jgi:hypothetical protein
MSPSTDTAVLDPELEEQKSDNPCDPHSRCPLWLVSCKHGPRSCTCVCPINPSCTRFALPRGFVRIRCFGFWANRCRATLLPQCRVLLLHNPKPHVIALRNCNPPSSAFFRCPQCASPMTIVETFPAIYVHHLR